MTLYTQFALVYQNYNNSSIYKAWLSLERCVHIIRLPIWLWHMHWFIYTCVWIVISIILLLCI